MSVFRPFLKKQIRLNKPKYGLSPEALVCVCWFPYTPNEPQHRPSSYALVGPGGELRRSTHTWSHAEFTESPGGHRPGALLRV